MAAQFMVLEAAGSPYEIGYAHGSGVKDRIGITLDFYKTRLCKDFNKSWGDIQNMGMDYLPVIEAYDKDMVEEMRGLADGSGLSFEEIVTLNCHFELGRKAATQPDGCTVIVLTDKFAEPDTHIMGMNWDYRVLSAGSIFIIKIRQNQMNKPDIMMITEAGIIGRMGFNSAGVGFCGDVVRSPYVGLKPPVHMVMRGILNSKTFAEAVGQVTAAGVGSSYCFNIGDNKGNGIAIEIDERDYGTIVPENGYIAHTNHFILPKFRERPEYTQYEPADDTIPRLEQAHRLLNAKARLDRTDLECFFRDHYNYPNAICRHPHKKDAPEARSASLCSLIINLNGRSMGACLGSPCENEYVEYSL